MSKHKALIMGPSSNISIIQIHKLILNWEPRAKRSSAMKLHDSTAARLYDVKSLFVDAIFVISDPDASKNQAKAAISIHP